MAKQPIRLILLLILVFSVPAQARFVEHATDTARSEVVENAKKEVRSYKKKISNWWSNKVNEYKKNE